MQKFDTPSPITAVLDIPAARIQFIAADRADTCVEILPADQSKSRDLKAAEQTTVTYADGVLRIEAAAAKNRILGNSGSIEVTVQLPLSSTSRRRPPAPNSAASDASATSPSKARRPWSSSTRVRAPASPSRPATCSSAA